MKNWFAAALCAVLVFALGITSPAGTWMKNDTGWWYDYGDGTWPAGTWLWVDGNRDGWAECYYFDDSGYLVTDDRTPDGYDVDSNGAWVDSGEVVRERSSYYRSSVDNPWLFFDGLYTASDGRTISIRSSGGGTAVCDIYCYSEDDWNTRTETYTIDPDTRSLYRILTDGDGCDYGVVRMWVDGDAESIWVQTQDMAGNAAGSWMDGTYRR